MSIRNWKGVLVTLDYPDSRIEFRDGALPTADNAEIFDFEDDARLPSVSIDVAGVSLRSNIDSGAARGVVLPMELASRVSTLAAPVDVEGVQTMSGQSRTTRATLSGSIRIGRYSIDRPEINFVEGFPVANLGYPILQRFAVTLDWQHHRLRLQEPIQQASVQ